MFSLRYAKPDDADSLVLLINTAFLIEQFFIERDRTNPQTIRDLMEKGKFIVAEHGADLVASVYVELRGDHGYFGMLSVDPSRQRQGVGRQLIAAAEKYFRDSDCKFSDLGIVSVRPELYAFYHRLGYVETRTAAYTDPVPTKMPVHFIEMSKALT